MRTVEHLLSACAGLGLTDAVVLLRGPEIPILDGSALPFVEAIEEASMTTENAGTIPLVLERPQAVTDDQGGVIVAYPAKTLSVAVIIDYPDHPAIGVQGAVYFGVNYKDEVAPARTYGFLSEFERLQQHGMALGAMLGRGVALLDNGQADSRTPMRFQNELARHKLLDLVGDLSLTGRPLQAGVVAARPSHALNVRFACLLADLAEFREIRVRGKNEFTARIIGSSASERSSRRDR